jgi:hypothetical protein
LELDVLYADKNGSGDLTENGKSFQYTKQALNISDPAYPLEEFRIFSLGDIADGKSTHTHLEETAEKPAQLPGVGTVYQKA